ncbi:MAG: hypothetical protein EOP06_04745 [Proteobacteria bacterium]|nr:MAG: hypothetical protein EOP06_04745 [Pseudomonadota bacterium]
MSGRAATTDVKSGQIALSVGKPDVVPPEGWRWVALTDVATLATGHTPSRRVSDYWDGDIPWVTVADAGPNDGGTITRTKECISEAGLQKSAAVLLPKGTVCLSRTGSIGYVVILGCPMATSQGFVNWICKDELDPRFLQLIFRAEKSFLQEISSGVAHTTIYFPEAKAFHVCIPGIEEQRRLLAVVDQSLSQLDAAVGSLNGVLQDVVRLKASIYKHAVEGTLVENESILANYEGREFESGQDLIDSTPIPKRPARWKSRSKDRKPGHAALGIGNISPKLPPGWGWAALVDVAEMRSGHTPSRSKEEYWNGDIPWIGIPDARERNRQTIYDTTQHITQAGLQGSAAQLLSIGTVCVSRTASVGYVVTTGRSMATSQDFVNWTPTGAVTSDWLNVVFSADRKVLESFAYGSVHLTIYFPEWLSMHIAVPPKAEQIRIAEEVERRITLAEKAGLVTEACLSRSAALGSAILVSSFPNNLKVEMNKARHIRATEREVEESNLDVQPMNSVPVKINRESQASTLRLHRFNLRQDFYSLKAEEFNFRKRGSARDMISPICLVGLNGSGKSNLIEVLSEVFCGLELTRLPWKAISGPNRKNKLDYELEYSIKYDPEGAEVIVHIEKSPEKDAVFTIQNGDKEPILIGGLDELSYLPTRVIGYSSGLNETISLPFLRTQSFYSDEVLNRAKREAQLKKEIVDYIDTRMLFCSYESNALVLVANYLFPDDKKLAPFKKNLNIDSLSSFKAHYKPSYKNNNNVELTKELEFYRDALLSATSDHKPGPKGKGVVLSYRSDDGSFDRLREAFGDRKRFFEATYKLSLLNSLEMEGPDKKFFQRKDIREGQLDRPPTVSRSKRIFDVDSIKLMLLGQAEPIDYAGLSDGEHQFIQVYGSAILFDEPGCLFLLDEPETHFNPFWRREFVELLNEEPGSINQEFVISTHSPFVVSGCHGKHVFKFSRVGNKSSAVQTDFETYGASYDFLLQRLFGLDSLVAELPAEQLKTIIETGTLSDLRAAARQFGESPEKEYLYEKIYEREDQEPRKK